MIIVTILVFFVILSFLVLIHEFGHFISAKKFGVKVEEFGLGLPPRAWGKKYKGTSYSLNWLPFGGFVKLKGEDPTEAGANDKDSFYTKSLPQRAIILSAGVFMNIILGIAIFYFMVAFSGFRFIWPSLFDHQFRGANQFQGILVEEVEKDSPAKAANLPTLTLITKANDAPVSSLEDLRKITRDNAGIEVAISTINPINGEEKSVTVTPRTEPENQKGTIGVLLSPVPYVVVEYKSLPSKIFVGFLHSWNLTEYNADAIGRLITSSISKGSVAPISQGVGGPIAIAQVTGQAVSLGFGAVLEFIGVLTLTLGVINVLPFPALDGGRLMFVGIEAIFRKRISPKFEAAVNTIGFFILISLIVLISFNDIARIISGNPFGSGILDLFKK